MGIERSGRKPKRRRTTAQRIKGRRDVAFVLPDGPAPAPTPKKTAAKLKTEKKDAPAAEVKSPAKKSTAAKKPTAKKADR